MWRNLKFSFIKINKVCNWWGLIAIYAILLLNLLFTLFCHKICFATIYALTCGGKFSQKVHLWRKNVKYEVCSQIVDGFYDSGFGSVPLRRHLTRRRKSDW